MAALRNNGWTAATLLPSIAAGFSPGSSVASKIAPAQVNGNPNSLKSAMSMSNLHQALIQRILGSTMKPQPVKAPGTNPAVNNLNSNFSLIQ